MATRASGSIWVAGHAGEVLRGDGVASVVADLGAPVTTIDLWGGPEGAPSTDTLPARVLVIEALDRPDLLARSLRALRGLALLRDAPVLAAIGARSITGLDPGAGHDDFIAWPAPAAELYARVRQLEWRSSAYADDDVVKLGPLLIHMHTREVSLIGAGASEHLRGPLGEGAPQAMTEDVVDDDAPDSAARAGVAIPLTAREFALLVALATRRGRVLTRQTLLEVVWGAEYEGGAKTVDVHVRRLRAKLGEALPLQTVRGAGYVLR